MPRTHTSAFDRGHSALGPALVLVHTGEAPTRSALTSALGVTRATAGAVIGELEALQLITVDTAPVGGTRGRPSHRLGVHPEGPVAVAAQLHIDGYTVALAELGGALVEVADHQHGPDDSPEAVLHGIARTAALLVERSGRRCVGAGLAAPTPVSETDCLAVGSGVLAWPLGTPIGALWTAAVRAAGLDVPTGVANDANLAALAEHRHGAGRGSGHLLYLTSGHLGIGGALVVDGRLYTGAGGLALEVGQLIVDPDGILCACGRRGDFEAEAAPDSLLRAAGLPADAPLHRLDGVFAASAEGEPRARAAVLHVADRLAWGLATLVDLLNPDRVVLGAFHSALLRAVPEGLIERVIEERSLWGRRGTTVPVCASVLGRPELSGAGELGWRGALSDPLAVLG